MPGGDRTGPEGRGSRTGRGAGYCSGYHMPGYANSDIPRFGRGFGFGRGMGRGFGRGFWGRGRGFWHRGYYPESYYEQTPRPYYREPYTEPNPGEEKQYLEQMVKDLDEELKHVKDRLQELSKQKKSPE